ncbi:Imm72 family immunity protein [Burkholderia gladioli]|uniref:Imm72 family immunity protein n=1 Tax=Burkholderia gladioli TaxID=28095 RepID=UPI0016414764|nr:Imm72 family immunity protein [Burkholderia gladioli]
MLEGTNDEHVVQWRLLWEDRRYQDGSIPEEEATYFPQAVMQQNLRALPGETCQRTGHWQSPAMKDSVYVEAGEPMPGPRHTSWGMVIWHYADPQPGVRVDLRKIGVTGSRATMKRHQRW